MTVKDIEAWCRANGVQARGFARGREFTIGGGEKSSSAPPPLTEVLHWELTIAGQSYPTSTSDMEWLVAGKLSTADFAKVMARQARAAE